MLHSINLQCQYLSTKTSGSIDNSGEITLSPTSSNAGDYTISFIISDECFEVSEEKSFTIR